jgi:signal-transduction protein with cAMP-binding, CBS, and nucleotidyltransferase domain
MGWCLLPAGEVAMNKVWKVLQSKGERTWSVPPEASVQEALTVMAEHGIGSVLVMEGGLLAGIITERDFARKLGVEGRSPSTVAVGEVMTRELITVTPGQSVNECMAIMTEKRIRHLPVVEDGRLVGLISIGDVVKDIIEELEFMLRQMESYVSGLR